MRRHVAGRSGVGVERQVPPTPSAASSRTKSRRPDSASPMASPRPPGPAPTMATRQCPTGSLTAPPRQRAMVSCAAVSISSTRTPLGSCRTARRTAPRGHHRLTADPEFGQTGNTVSRSA